MKKYAAALLLLINSVVTFSQEIPTAINYQGLLKDASGTVVSNGNYNITFNLYASESSEAILWSETKVIPVSDGIINTQLGDQTPLSIPFDITYWLGITIESGAELIPRIKLSSVPYSFMSMNVMDGSVTASKIPAGTVVKSINSLKDSVTLKAGSNITITPDGNNLTISAEGGGSGTIGGSGSTNYIPRFTSGTALGNSILYQNGGNIGLGTVNPLYPLHVSVNRKYAGYFTTDSLSTSSHVLHAEMTGTGNIQSVGIYGKCVTADAYGTGGSFMGGYIGLYATVKPTGTQMYRGVMGTAEGGSGTNMGVHGVAVGPGTNYGLFGSAEAGNINCGVYGNAPETGIEGNAINTSGVADGVKGISNSTGGTGVFGYASATSNLMNYGGYFVSKSTQGIGTLGYANAGSGITYGGYFRSNSNNGYGVYGYAPSAATGASFGVRGESASPTGYGIYGYASGTGKNYGVYGITGSQSGYAVYGWGRKYAIEGFAINETGIADGVRGVSNSTGGTGVFAWAQANTGTTYGIFSTIDSPTGYAGYFVGKVHVTGTLTKGAGAFKIDHPLDPQNKYLYHSFVESPDMKNIYDGNAVTDAAGFAIVALPDWFESLNKDFRYQLTVIGEFAQAIISREIQNNNFEIRTDKPGVKVSWQVTGIRKDAYAENNRIPVEEEKTAEEKGRYLYPESFGLTKNQGIDAIRRPVETETRTEPPAAPEQIQLRQDLESYKPPVVSDIQSVE